MKGCDEGGKGFPGQRMPPTRVRVFFLWIAFFLFTWGPSFAQDPGKETVISGPVTIENKEDGGIVVAGKRYRVEESTVILDAAGNRISLCDLSLPCEAKVEYRLTENYEPLCLRIETIRVLKTPPDFVIADDPG